MKVFASILLSFAGTLALCQASWAQMIKDPEILEGIYTESRDYLESVPYVSKKGLEIILAELGEKEVKARQAKPEDFIDMRFVAELERDGFFKKLREK
ncbi:MAG: hypothetical protein HY695_35280 [Deltaproteobacteria bacterium]|nr:hypothetical protein [Deltaproteobacteria bacterium]